MQSEKAALKRQNWSWTWKGLYKQDFWKEQSSDKGRVGVGEEERPVKT